MNSDHRNQATSWEGRCWVDASPIHVVQGSAARVRLLQYRLLAHSKTAYVNYSLHKAWEWRSSILFQEIRCYDADILCLQDVDLFEEFWYPKLMSMGYDMVFKKRTQEKEYRNEGILTAFRRDRFQLVRTVELEFNDAVDDRKGVSFRERCRTDDVGLIVFLEPNIPGDLMCSFCVGNAMLSELVQNADVREAHMEYFVAQIDLANREFQSPVLMGVNLNDLPASPAYTLLRTGRTALTAAVPLACTDVTAASTCRGSALVQWLPPKMTIADSPITAYEVAWRPGGSTTLGFTLHKVINAGDCIHYSERVDEHGRKKIVADTKLQYVIAGLCAEVVYEFVVRGINSEGSGLWSEPSAPIILPNPEKAPSLPKLSPQFFSNMERVIENRERDKMALCDWNTSLAMRADPLNAPTQLTPRLEGEGRVNFQISRNRVLPAIDNPRSGWKSSLQGIPTPTLTTELARDGVLHRSILRDKMGFRERNLNSLQYDADHSAKLYVSDLYSAFGAPESEPVVYTADQSGEEHLLRQEDDIVSVAESADTRGTLQEGSSRSTVQYGHGIRNQSEQSRELMRQARQLHAQHVQREEDNMAHNPLLHIPGISTFAQNNPMVLPVTAMAARNAQAKALDGSSLLLDAREVLHHIGIGHNRGRHELGLRSAYEVGGSSGGEMMFSAVIPRERNSFGTETLDYIFYGAGHGVVVQRILALPSVSVLLNTCLHHSRGETPEASYLTIDEETVAAPRSIAGNYDDLVLSLYSSVFTSTRGELEDEDLTAAVARLDEDVETKRRSWDEDDDIDFGYGHNHRDPSARLPDRENSNVSESDKKQKEREAQAQRERQRSEKKRDKLDSRYTDSDIQEMKRLLVTRLKKSHAKDNQAAQVKAQPQVSADELAFLARGKSGAATTVDTSAQQVVTRSYAQYKGSEFWGGQWHYAPVRNPHRQNAFLPNARFASTHFALVADFVINDDILGTRWMGK